MALIGQEQRKVLEVLEDGVARDASTILSLGEGVLHLGTVLKVLAGMADEGLLEEHTTAQPTLFSITEMGKEHVMDAAE